ncbi:hypothetical protein LEP1GSC060_0861 [Leptospira weilii serovar Ranarum str. ICFT]|uniref:Uncharacterized protein n=1 Tax=Leptospira weilii serovar Ranarum str. ICFT TaxID=1218598 RepID=N1WSZ6_9LEPT|nr:hypothetical protein LEP1GSC060_0861 [Leptospira weilii serovar Ranarum str. ICFT]
MERPIKKPILLWDPENLIKRVNDRLTFKNDKSDKFCIYFKEETKTFMNSENVHFIRVVEKFNNRD